MSSNFFLQDAYLYICSTIFTICFFILSGHHPYLHVLTHSFPTRRSSDRGFFRRSDRAWRDLICHVYATVGPDGERPAPPYRAIEVRKGPICSTCKGSPSATMDPKDDMLVAAHPASRDFAPPMTEKNNVAPDGLVPTPTECAQPRRFSDFATVGEALDYAAQGSRGLNFHDPRGHLVQIGRASCRERVCHSV